MIRSETLKLKTKTQKAYCLDKQGNLLVVDLTEDDNNKITMKQAETHLKKQGYDISQVMQVSTETTELIISKEDFLKAVQKHEQEKGV